MKDVFPVTAQFLGVRSTFLRRLNPQSLNRQHELPQVHPRFLAGASAAFAYSRLTLIYLISLHRHEFVLRKICSSILECAADAKRNWYLFETTRFQQRFLFRLFRLVIPLPLLPSLLPRVGIHAHRFHNLYNKTNPRQRTPLQSR